MEPGENWIDETYERKAELGPLPGWELPLDWTSPDTTAEKKEILRRKLLTTVVQSCQLQEFPVDTPQLSVAMKQFCLVFLVVTFRLLIF